MAMYALILQLKVKKKNQLQKYHKQFCGGYCFRKKFVSYNLRCYICNTFRIPKNNFAVQLVTAFKW